MENAINKVYSSPILVRLLRGVDLFAVVFTAVAYAVTVIARLLGEVYSLALKLVLVCFLPFILVSLVRRLINAPRPYEIYSSIPTPRRKKGSSFPSRHVFSAFAIGTLLCFIAPILGVLALILGVCLGACRVFLGIHFIRDVLCGAAIGIASSVIGMLIVNI